MHNFLHNHKVSRLLNGVVAGTTDQNGTGVDTLGFLGCTFVGLFGALTATQVTQMKVQQSDDNATWEDVEGTLTGPLTDADGNKMLAIDIYKPAKRYLRPVVDRGTANAVIDGVICILSRAGSVPVTQSTTIMDYTILAEPVAGTP